MKVLVTGCWGLVGAAVVDHFCSRRWTVHGIDCDMRKSFFGKEASVERTAKRLSKQWRRFHPIAMDIRNPELWRTVAKLKPSVVVHAAAQPSHDLAATKTVEDFTVNAFGTLNLMQAIRQHAPKAVVVYLSTNKVYGDGVNGIRRVELPRRFDFIKDFSEGVPEIFPVDQCMHSLFGVSKLAGDLLVQEYGRYFGIKSCCLRCGCLTGEAHQGVELHGFLSYLTKCCVRGMPYTVHGHKGKQVRDQLHARDVAAFVEQFVENPRVGEVYNMGGGKANTVSVIEAIDKVQQATGRALNWTYSDAARAGDHIVYYSDLSKLARDYPKWKPSASVDDILKCLTA